jgi:hypothetical protein
MRFLPKWAEGKNENQSTRLAAREPDFFQDDSAKAEGTTPLGLVNFRPFPQGSLARPATRGFGAQSLGDWPEVIARFQQRNGSWSVGRAKCDTGLPVILATKFTRRHGGAERKRKNYGEVKVGMWINGINRVRKKVRRGTAGGTPRLHGGRDGRHHRRDLFSYD